MWRGFLRQGNPSIPSWSQAQPDQQSVEGEGLAWNKTGQGSNPVEVIHSEFWSQVSLESSSRVKREPTLLEAEAESSEASEDRPQCEVCGAKF